MEALDPLTDPRWSELLERSPDALIFHHPAWLRIVHDQYRYPLWAWVVSGPDGRLAAGIPVALLRSRLTGTRLIALPFSDTCPPLLDPASETTPERFTDEMERARAARGLDFEVRADLPGGHGAVVSKRFVKHRLALGADVAAVEARFSKGQVKRGIAKARREGVWVERRTDLEGLRRFYRLHVGTRRHQGVPTQPKTFILRFVELFRAGLGFVLLARHEGRDIAAAVFLAAGGTLTYEFGASDRQFLGVRPNNLLFSEAIRWGCEHAQHTLDFGRSDLENEGLRAFKRAWGAEESPLRYSQFGSSPRPQGAGRSRRAMKVIIPRAPAAFGRMVGAALYRHMG